MMFALGRNESYAKVRNGDYANVRMRTQAELNISDADASYIAPPPPDYNPVGGFPDGGWVTASGDVEDVNNTVSQFSAMCWCCAARKERRAAAASPRPVETLASAASPRLEPRRYFAESMVDHERSLLKSGDALTPVGLVHASWGGTIAEMWIPNATLYDADKGCKNVTGGPPFQRDDYANGALFNGMVRPWANSSFAAVLWYPRRRPRLWIAATPRPGSSTLRPGSSFDASRRRGGGERVGTAGTKVRIISISASTTRRTAARTPYLHAACSRTRRATRA